MTRPLTLVGFSGSGKSHLARRLAAERGYRHLDCDLRIEEKLASSLPRDGSGTRRLANWLGQPYDLGFPGRQQRYFFAEQEVLSEMLDDLANAPSEAPTVIDTTGSVIYVEGPLLERLRDISTVVYLRIAAEDEQAMFEQYLADPKPVLWQQVYQQLPGESRAEALRRCYPQLIAQRSELYERLAHCVVDTPYCARDRFSLSEFFATVNGDGR